MRYHRIEEEGEENVKEEESFTNLLEKTLKSGKSSPSETPSVEELLLSRADSRDPSRLPHLGTEMQSEQSVRLAHETELKTARIERSRTEGELSDSLNRLTGELSTGASS